MGSGRDPGRKRRSDDARARGVGRHRPPRLIEVIEVNL